MGINPRINLDDPRRWNADPQEERRWEKVWLENRARTRDVLKVISDTTAVATAQQNALDALKSTLDAIPNRTTQSASSADKEIWLSGTRAIRGKRSKTVRSGDEFGEWVEQVTFGAAFPAPPVVFLNVEQTGNNPIDLSGEFLLTLYNVTERGFYFRLTCTPPQLSATIHWRAEGDA